jgi:quercetin dioxygenase-like cupin family protein
MVEGSGVLMIEGEKHPVTQGSYAFVPANADHQFRNTGQAPFRFICIVPKEGHQ